MALQSIRKSIPILVSALKQISLIPKLPASLHKTNIGCTQCQHFSCTSKKLDLKEFFDDPQNYEKGTRCKVGRPWRRDELRIKSNEDLHKLWYVLLKERNMLMTMEHEYRRQMERMPSSERFEKVEESMNNILMVVNERDKAIKMLETGSTGRKKSVLMRNFVGIPYRRVPREHLVPWYLNKNFKLLHRSFEPWMIKHLKRYNEKMNKSKRKFNQVVRKRKKIYMKKYPDLSKEDLHFGLSEYKRFKKFGLLDYEKHQRED